jgi:hypothetical protein
VIKRIRRDRLSQEETQAKALLAAEKEAAIAMEDGDYVGVIFDENDFRDSVGNPVDGALLKEGESEDSSKNLNRINANSIGYAPANLKVATFKGGNILTRIPTGKKYHYMHLKKLKFDVGDIYPVPYAETWGNDLDKVLKLVRNAYTAFPQTVLKWETWCSNAPRCPSDSTAYIPFAKELFGLENYKNGDYSTYCGAQGVTNLPDGSVDNTTSAGLFNTEYCATGFGKDMLQYETAPSMTFGKHANIVVSSVPYMQIGGNGKPCFTTENNKNITIDTSNKRKKRKLNNDNNRIEEFENEAVDEDGYVELTLLGKHKIPIYGDPINYVGKVFKFLSKKTKSALKVDYEKCYILAVVKKIEDDIPLFKFCDATIKCPTKDQLRYYECKRLMSRDKQKNGIIILYF